MGKKENYPVNLLTALHLNEMLGTSIEYEKLTADQIRGVEYIFSRLTEREQVVLSHYYKEGMSRKAISEKYRLGENYIRRIIEKALKKIRVKELLSYVANGYEANKKRLEEQLKAEEARFCKLREITDQTHIYYQKIEYLNLPVRTYNPLKRANIQTIRDLLIFVCSARHLRTFGEVSMALVSVILEKENLLPKGYIKDDKGGIPQLDLEVSIFQKLNFCEHIA